MCEYDFFCFDDLLHIYLMIRYIPFAWSFGWYDVRRSVVPHLHLVIPYPETPHLEYLYYRFSASQKLVSAIPETS
jgi:hypothetical protein